MLTSCFQFLSSKWEYFCLFFNRQNCNCPDCQQNTRYAYVLCMTRNNVRICLVFDDEILIENPYLFFHNYGVSRSALRRETVATRAVEKRRYGPGIKVLCKKKSPCTCLSALSDTGFGPRENKNVGQFLRGNIALSAYTHSNVYVYINNSVLYVRKSCRQA